MKQDKNLLSIFQMQLVFVILQGIALLIILVQDTVNLAPFNNLGAWQPVGKL